MVPQYEMTLSESTVHPILKKVKTLEGKENNENPGLELMGAIDQQIN